MQRILGDQVLHPLIALHGAQLVGAEVEELVRVALLGTAAIGELLAQVHPDGAAVKGHIVDRPLEEILYFRVVVERGTCPAHRAHAAVGSGIVLVLGLVVHAVADHLEPWLSALGRGEARVHEGVAEGHAPRIVHPVSPLRILFHVWHFERNLLGFGAAGAALAASRASFAFA